MGRIAHSGWVNGKGYRNRHRAHADAGLGWGTVRLHLHLRRRGAVLLVVLWVIALLSFMLITALTFTMQTAEGAVARKTVSRARQLAEMGLAVASHPAVAADDPILRRRISTVERYEAQISTEEARLNLNALLTEEGAPLLERIFRQWGLPEMEAETLVDRLMDWVDADEFRRLKGAERREYEDEGRRGMPYNRRFRTLDEVLNVLGMEELTAVYPTWREQFTLLGSGQLDLNEAEPSTLASFFGVSLTAAQTFVQRRLGPDELPHTEDDLRWESVGEALAYLGIGEIEAAPLQPLLTIKGPTSRIVSIGWVGDYVRGVSVVLENRGPGAQMLEWREFVPETLPGTERRAER